VRFPRMAALAAVTIFAMAACGAAATAVPASPGASTAVSSGAATPAASTPSGGSSASAGAASASAGAASAPAGAASDPCTLLSAADLNTVTGAKYATGAYDATYKWCEWIDKDGGDVILAISDNPFATVKGTLTQGVDLTVSGHPAFWDPESGVRSMLVDLGGKTLELSFPKASSDGDVDQTMAQKLAEIAVGKM